MRQFIRTLIVLFALAEGAAWTMFTAGVWQWGMTGAGAGAGAGGGGSGAAALFAMVLIAAIWLLPVSPYLCMAGGALNLITGKSLRVAYVYALVVLALMTLIELVTFQRSLEFMALGNILAGGLWAYSFHGAAPGELGEQKKPQEPDKPR